MTCVAARVWFHLIYCVAALSVVLCHCEVRGQGDVLRRMSLERLEATHRGVEQYRAQQEPVTLTSGYEDYRAIIHAHSHFSHDSVGQMEEIIPAAKQVGVQVIMFSNHTADTYDYYTDTDHGLIDGVLVIPGAETGGLLAYPTRSVQNQLPSSPPQPYVDLVCEDGGLAFVCHLEERLDWELEGITGNEIYNTHADLMEETQFVKELTNPLMMMRLIPALERYPQETFAAIQDYPMDYMRAWDRWCQRAPHTGVAGNDSHHNQRYRGIVTEDGKLALVDIFDKELALLDPAKVAPIKLLINGRKPGTVVFDIDLDPYDRSFHHVSTHLLMHELSEDAVRDALRQGRCYVAFDWMADPTGFVFQATPADMDAAPHVMGSQFPLTAGLKLQTAATLPTEFRLLRDGQELARVKDVRQAEWEVSEPGVYRVEAWLVFAGEPRPWIFSNPIYVRGE